MGSTTDAIDRIGRIALDQLRGIKSIQVRGQRYNISGFTEATVWDGPEDIYTFTDPTTDRIDTASSSSAADVGKNVQIEGLDENWNTVTQVVTLSGRAKVLLGTELIRINQIIAFTDLIGDLYVYEDTAILNGVPIDGSKIKGYIDAGNNITQMAVYTIPSGFKGIFKTAAYGLVPSAQCCSAFINASRTYGFAEIRFTRFPLVEGGTTLTLQTPKTSFSVPEKTDVYMLVETSTPGAGVMVVSDWELIKV